MKCRYTFIVQTNVKLDHKLLFNVGDRRFGLVNENGRLSKVVVEIADLSAADTGNFNWPDDLTEGAHINIRSPMLDEITSQIHAVRGALTWAAG